MAHEIPAIVCDCDDAAVAIFPRISDDTSAAEALLRSCNDEQRTALRRAGVRSSLRVPFSLDGISGEFRCESRAARKPSFELHAAAELFAQLFAMRIEIDDLKHR
jgi:light-regulated signal transduction histidine kinase (bacteriophytochrome)